MNPSSNSSKQINKFKEFFGQEKQQPPQEENDITDIAEIFHKLNSNKPVKAYSEYDASSIFPPPSLASLNHHPINHEHNQSDQSKSHCFENSIKRSAIIAIEKRQNRQECPSSVSKYDTLSKKIKKIEVQKIRVDNSLDKNSSFSKNEKCIVLQKVKHSNSNSNKFFSISQKLTQEKQINSKIMQNKVNKEQQEHHSLNHSLKNDSIGQVQSNKIVKQSRNIQNFKTLEQKNLKITDFFSFKEHFKKQNLLQKKQTKQQRTQNNNPIKQQQKTQNQNHETKQLQKPGKFQKSSTKNQLKTQIQQNKNSLLINSLIQKNQKRKKTIEQLRKQLQNLKNHKNQTKQKLFLKKQQQKSRLKSQLLQTNRIKCGFQQFKQQMYKKLTSQIIQRNHASEIENRIKILQENKKKGNKKGKSNKEIHTDQQSLINGQNANNILSPTIQSINSIPDRKNYMNQWIGKLQKFKQKIQNDKNFYNSLNRINKKSCQIPQNIQNAFQKSNTFKDYVLYSIRDQFNFSPQGSKSSVQQCKQLISFNLEHLRQQILTLIEYPKFSPQTRKAQIQKQLQNIFKMSKKIYNSANLYFLPTTIASQIGQLNEFIVIGRQKNQGFQSLFQAIQKYQSLSQTIIRHLVRICLIVFQEVKVKVDMPCYILPFNIYFTQKYDVKFSNILFNKLFLTEEEFRPYLNNSNSKYYYYLAPQALSLQKDYSNISLWSLGILLYYLIYDKYPFQYSFEQSSNFMKETFFIYNELIFPAKPVVNQKLKDLIQICLYGKQKDYINLLKHPFFSK